MKTLIKEYPATAQPDNSIIEDAKGAMYCIEWSEDGMNYRTVFQELQTETDLRKSRVRTFNQIFKNGSWKTIENNDPFISDDTTYVDQTGAEEEQPYEDDLTKPIQEDDLTKPIKDENGEVTGYEKKTVGYEQKLKAGLITEAQFHINLLSPTIHALVSEAIKRRLGIS